jgi:hypothetical protein
MAKKVEEEKVEATNVEVKKSTSNPDVIVGKNPFITVYSRISDDGQNGEKLEVITKHGNLVVLVKCTEIVNGKVSVSIATTNEALGIGKDNEGNVEIN